MLSCEMVTCAPPPHAHMLVRHTCKESSAHVHMSTSTHAEMLQAAGTHPGQPPTTMPTALARTRSTLLQSLPPPTCTHAHMHTADHPH